MISPSIYDFVRAEEAKFETEEIQVGENWYWNMRRHVQLIFHLMHGVFFTGENNWIRQFKQIMRPLIRLSVWTEDLEVKDVVFYIENHMGRVLSFFIKKYHDEVYVKEHDLDTLFDEITESDIAYGGALVQKGVKRPEIVPLQSVAFCDQTDLIGGVIGFKHYFTPDKLRSMSKFGWGEEKNGATMSLDDLCLLATAEKEADGAMSQKKNKTTGKTIEVYIVRGNLPSHYLNDDNDMETTFNQLQIIALYTDQKNQKQGVTLYRKKEVEGSLKLHVSEKVYNRALGYSDGEALLYPQIFTNLAAIYRNQLLEAGSKVPLVTSDQSFQDKNTIVDMENLQLMTVAENTTIPPQPIRTAFPENYSLMEKSVNELYESGQLNVQGFDTLMGKEESAGTTFRGQERLVAQGRGWHDRRRGQRAKFIEEIYRDWIIPDMTKEILGGKKFLAELSLDEVSWVADQLATNYVEKKVVDIILNEDGEPTDEDKAALKEFYRSEFLKRGNKQLLEILKDEFRDVEIKVGVNIANKQKNLAGLSDKILSILQVAMVNPQFKQNLEANGMTKSFNDLLEYSGISPVAFSTVQGAAPSITSPVQMAGLGQEPVSAETA